MAADSWTGCRVLGLRCKLLAAGCSSCQSCMLALTTALRCCAVQHEKAQAVRCCGCAQDVGVREGLPHRSRRPW